MSGGAPFTTCACVYKLGKDVPDSFISLSITRRYKLSCAKTFFLVLPQITGIVWSGKKLICLAIYGEMKRPLASKEIIT